MMYLLLYLYHLWLLMFHLLMRLCILNCLFHLLYLTFGCLFLRIIPDVFHAFFFSKIFLSSSLSHMVSRLLMSFSSCCCRSCCNSILFLCTWFTCGSSYSCMIRSCWRTSIYFPGRHSKRCWLLSITGFLYSCASFSSLLIMSWSIGRFFQM